MKKNFTICIMLVISVLWSIETNAQSSSASNAYNALNYLGWSTAGGPLPFSIGGGVAAPLMLLTTGGNFGIGNTFTPSFKLDVDAGDINLNTGTNSYRISGSPVLWHDNNTRDIFVGVGAGNSTMSGHCNSFVGKDAGIANATGDSLTFVGFEAGKANTDGRWNTAIGCQALASNPDLMYNTAVGYQSLFNSSTCPLCWDQRSTLNTAVGYQSLFSSQGYGGCALGFRAGFSNNEGCGIVAIGEEAMHDNTDGDYNLAIGAHAMQRNTLLSWNVAVGHWALHVQDYTGSGTNASHNVAVGNWALQNNNPTSDVTGIDNTALGNYALFENTEGSYNVGNGFQAGYTNTRGNYNLNEGVSAGYYNAASYNTFVGAVAGVQNTSGLANCFVGYGAGNVNTTSNYNSALGLLALGASTGHDNTALGYRAGFTNTTGRENTFVGSGADANGTGYTNCGAYGYNTVVTASNKIFMGDVNLIGCYNFTGVWGAYSDGRFKINVQENVSGLDFIKLLRPVTYNMDAQALDGFLHQNAPPSLDSSGNIIVNPPGDFTEATSRLHSGFIAQEVEQASLASGFTSSIVSAPANANDPYALNYSEFVVPLVKAVQQLDSINMALQTQISDLQAIVSTCCTGSRLGSPPQGEGNNESGNLQNTGSNEFPLKQTIDLASSDPILYQNQPNPFDNTTVIRYFISENSKQPKIIFQDETGRTINETAITEMGQGSIQINAASLNSGIYTYSLQIDGKIIDSKKMLKAK